MAAEPEAGLIDPSLSLTALSSDRMVDFTKLLSVNLVNDKNEMFSDNRKLKKILCVATAITQSLISREEFQ